MTKTTETAKPNQAKSEGHRLMLTLPPLKILVKQSISNSIGFVILSLYQLIDSIFVGNYLSQDGLAAQSVTYAFEYFFDQLLLMSFSVGVTAFIGPELSRQNYDKVSSYASQFFVICLIYSVAMPIITVPLSREIAIVMGANGSRVLTYCIHYLQIIFSLGPSGYGMNVAFLPLLRSENKTLWVMLLQGTSSVINILLDVLFFMVWIDKLDMFAPALSTAISLWCTGLFLTVLLFIKKSPTYTKFAWRKMRLTWSFLASTFVQALPQIVNALPFVVGQTMANNYIKQYAPDRSSQVQSIYGISFKYAMFIVQPRLGVYHSFISIVSYNLGQRQFGRIRALINHAIWLSIVIGLIISALLIALTKPLIQLFEKDPEFVAYGVPLMRLSYIGYWAGNQINVLSGLKQMERKPMTAMVFQLLRLIVMIIVTVVLPRVCKIDYIIIQQSLTDLICFVPCSFFVYFEQKRFQKLALEQEKNVTQVV